MNILKCSLSVSSFFCCRWVVEIFHHRSPRAKTGIYSTYITSKSQTIQNQTSRSASVPFFVYLFFFYFCFHFLNYSCFFVSFYCSFFGFCVYLFHRIFHFLAALLIYWFLFYSSSWYLYVVIVFFFPCALIFFLSSSILPFERQHSS
jgi:hypothetical protein